MTILPFQAYMTVLSAAVTWFAGRRMALSPRARLALHAFAITGFAQATIGITTLLTYVPVWLASLHQNGFMILLTAAFWLTTEIRRLPVK